MTKQKMTKGYKYMSNDDTTLYNTKWGDGVTHEAVGGDWELCSEDLIHFYPNKYTAALMDPIHGKYTETENYIMRTCVAEGKVVTNGLKSGAKKVTTGRRVKPIKLTREQRVECAIRISLLVYDEPRYVQWAEKWLSGEDRSSNSARDACYTTNATDVVAITAYFAAYYAADAAYCAADAYYSADTVAYAVNDAVDAGADMKEIVKIIKSVLEKQNE